MDIDGGGASAEHNHPRAEQEFLFKGAIFFSEKFLRFYLVKICVGSSSMRMILCNRGDKSKTSIEILESCL